MSDKVKVDNETMTAEGIRDLLDRLGDRPLGPTGEFPKGKLNESDDGGLNIAVGAEGENVVLHFGSSVNWIGFGPDEADAVASALNHYAQKIRESKMKSN